MSRQMAQRRDLKLKLLIVEDDSEFASRLTSALSQLRPGIDVHQARSRKTGIIQISHHEFDFIICDLKLPPEDGRLDTSEVHGLAVHAAAKDECPGTPCLFFTGYGRSSAVSHELSHGGTADVLGTGHHYGLTQILTKDDFNKCIDRLNQFNSSLEELKTTEVRVKDPGSALSVVEERALRLIGRRLESQSVEVSILGGLSEARALRARIVDRQGNLRGSFFVKIGSNETIDAEAQRYHQFVSPLLKLGGYPALVDEIRYGLRKNAALIYQLADEYSLTLFDILSADESQAAAVIDSLKGTLHPWTDFKEGRTVRIGDVRSERIPNKQMHPITQRVGRIDECENVFVETTLRLQHGDLHGSNVLCKPDGSPLIVDFASIRTGPACLDPVFLELSVIFHIDSPFRNQAWPTIEQAESWFDLDVFLRECPAADFVKACRSWAVAASPSIDLAAVVYIEAARQLKYEDTNHELAIAIATAASRRLLLAQ